jgi:hypothetical protein
VKATSNLPLLTVEDDGAVFVSGDITKFDTYELEFEPEVKGITAIRSRPFPTSGSPLTARE